MSPLVIVPFNSRYYGTNEPIDQVIFMWHGFKVEVNRVFRACPIGAEKKEEDKGMTSGYLDNNF